MAASALLGEDGVHVLDVSILSHLERWLLALVVDHAGGEHLHVSILSHLERWLLVPEQVQAAAARHVSILSHLERWLLAARLRDLAFEALQFQSSATSKDGC